MRFLAALIATILVPLAAHAMVYGDSKILDRDGLKGIGVAYLAKRGPDGLTITVSAEKTGGPPRFESMSCIVLRQPSSASVRRGATCRHRSRAPSAWHSSSTVNTRCTAGRTVQRAPTASGVSA